MDIITKARACDGCKRVLAEGEGKRFPSIPPVDCCSKECVTAAFDPHVADLPETAEDAIALQAAKVAEAVAAAEPKTPKAGS